MKILKKLWLCALSLAVAACLFSCGGGGNEDCTEHVDDNGDNICDVCTNPIESDEPQNTEIKLIEDGAPTFQIVFDKELPSTVRIQVNALVKTIKEATGVEVKVKLDVADGAQDVEILVGCINSRGEEYKFDYHELGPKGTAIRLVGNKLVLSAGSENSYIDLIKNFAEDYLGIEDDELAEQTVSFTTEQCYVEPQTNYRLKSLSIGDNLIDDYIIVVDKMNYSALNAAKTLQNDVYTATGKWLQILDAKSATSPDKAIIINILEKDGVSDGYQLSLKGNNVVFDIMFENLIQEKVEEFIALFKIKSGDVKLTASMINKTQNVRVITYADKRFNVDNTGETDASVALKELHAYANQYGHDVKSGTGTFLILGGNEGGSIVIRTNTDWTGATFIFDDRRIAEGSAASKANVFVIDTDYKHTSMKSAELAAINEQIQSGNVDFRSLTNFFGFEPGYKCMLTPTNANHKVYIRYGGNANDGNNQCEPIIVDEKGNIDPDTPFLLDYTEITGVGIYRIDDTPITITGGTFITRANSARCSYSTGFTRNIRVSRSNVTIKGLVHRITDEGDLGTCYSGFISASYANNMLVEECVFQAHRAYVDETVLDDGTIKYGTTMGTYELGGYMSNKLYYKNCSQSNFYDKNGNASTTWYDEDWNTAKNNQGATAGLWGVMGTNYCKNITYDNSTLSRLDAHAGVYNASIINGSNVIMVSLIGGGTALIEDSTIHSNYFVNLRNDYGSTWNGDVIIRNSTLKTSSATPKVFIGTWYHHYFGYTCYLPNLIMDNVTVTSDYMIHLYGDFTGTSTIYENMPDDETKHTLSDVDISADKVMINGKLYDNVNKTELPRYIIIKNCDDLNYGYSPDYTLNEQLKEIHKNSNEE